MPRLRHADALGDEGRDLRRHDADGGLTHGKARTLGADRHVGDAQDAEAAGNGVALDRRDDHLRRAVQHFEEGAELAVPDRDRVLLAGLGLVGEALLHILEVRAGAESAARTAQDHDLDVATVAQDAEHRLQLLDQRRVERVLHFRPVERHVETRPLTPEKEGFVLVGEFSHRCSTQAFLPLHRKGRCRRLTATEGSCSVS